MNPLHEISKLELPLKLPIYFGLSAFILGIPINLVLSKSIRTTVSFGGFYLMTFVFIGSAIFHREFSTYFLPIIKVGYALFAIFLLILTNVIHGDTSVVIPSAIYACIAISFILVIYSCFININKETPNK